MTNALPDRDYEILSDLLNVSHETFEKLKRYQFIAEKWQRSINLVAPSTVPDFWIRHIVDSVQLAQYISSHDDVIMDMGSGAGFPGLVLSILGYNNVHLIESDQRKCIFLREVSRETFSSPIIHQDRIESVSIDNVRWVTSRACANVSQLLSWSKKNVSRETKCLFHKGKNYSIELSNAEKEWNFDVIAHPSVTEQGAAILELSHITRRGP